MFVEPVNTTVLEKQNIPQVLFSKELYRLLASIPDEVYWQDYSDREVTLLWLANHYYQMGHNRFNAPLPTLKNDVFLTELSIFMDIKEHRIILKSVNVNERSGC